MKNLCLGLTLLLSILFNSCTRGEEKSAEPAQSEFRPTATIKDIMDSIIDPSADELWQSVSSVFDMSGLHEKSPETDEEWKQVRRSAIRLIEGSNLLLIHGRIVARSGEKSENPGVELEPEEMQKLIEQDRASFVDLAHGLHDSAMVALKAIDTKDKNALLVAGQAIDEACEHCHLRYWYPNEAKTQAEQRGQPTPSVK